MNINWTPFYGFFIFENLIPGKNYQIPREYLEGDTWTVVAEINVFRPTPILVFGSTKSKYVFGSTKSKYVFVETSKTGKYSFLIEKEYDIIKFYINGKYTGFGDCSNYNFSTPIYINLENGNFELNLFMLKK
jgi:hypothetical protein